MKILALVAVVALTACSDLPVPAEPTRHVAPASAPAFEMLVNERDEGFPTSVTACNGETVDLDARGHIKVALTQTPAGGLNIMTSADFDFSGIGATTGVKYQGSIRSREQNILNQAITSIKMKSSMKLVGQGRVEDTDLDVTFDLLIANDNVRVNRVDFSNRCNELQ